MEAGYFYFIKDEYYEKFANCGIMSNKAEEHGRPCYYSIYSDGYYWMVPISSKVEKYKNIYNKKIKQYPIRIDTTSILIFYVFHVCIVCKVSKSHPVFFGENSYIDKTNKPA